MQNRLDVILETVDQILEGAKRTKERRQYRASQARKTFVNYIENLKRNKNSPYKLGSRMVPGEADENWETMTLAIPHTGARLMLADKLRELRKTNPAAAIRLLNVQSGREPNEPTKVHESAHDLLEGAKRARERRQLRDTQAQGASSLLADMLATSGINVARSHPGWPTLINQMIRPAIGLAMKHSKERKERADSLRYYRNRKHGDTEFAQGLLNIDSGRNRNDSRT